MKKLIAVGMLTLAFFAAILNPAHSKSLAGPGLPPCAGINNYLNDNRTLQNDSAKIEFKVSGKCGMCKKRVEKAAMSIAGVKTANWDKTTKIIKIVISDNKITQDVISKAIAAVGHDTGFDKADDKVYDALPDCCHYERVK